MTDLGALIACRVELVKARREIRELQTALKKCRAHAKRRRWKNRKRDLALFHRQIDDFFEKATRGMEGDEDDG